MRTPGAAERRREELAVAAINATLMWPKLLRILGAMIVTLAVCSWPPPQAAGVLGLDTALAASPGATQRVSLFAPHVVKAFSDTTEGLALGIYRPELPNRFDAIDTYERDSGRVVSIIHWFAHWTPGSWKRDLAAADLDAVKRRGGTPMISWGPDGGSLRQVVLSGANDAYIDTWAKMLASYGQPVLLRFGWEMNNQPMYDWAVGVNGNTPEDYQAAWRYIRGRFLAVGATNVQWVWCPNNDPNPLPVFQAIYPGDDQVDWLGIDSYNTGPALDWGSPAWTPLVDLLAPTYRALQQISRKQMVICELGSTEVGGDKASWIADGLGAAIRTRYPQIKAVVWFDVNKEQPWQIDSSSNARSSFINVIKQSHFTSRFAAVPGGSS